MSDYLTEDFKADLEAINTYIMTPGRAKTAAAKKLKNDWLAWFDTLGFWEKNFDSTIYDRARNKRHDFDLANTTTSADKQAVINQMTTGLTSEELQGQTRRTTEEGYFIVPDEPFIPDRITYSILGLGILASLGYAAKLYFFGFSKPKRPRYNPYYY
jgi:hypothetical protein